MQTIKDMVISTHNSNLENLKIVATEPLWDQHQKYGSTWENIKGSLTWDCKEKEARKYSLYINFVGD